MCGILLVKSTNNLDHAPALKLLSNRGPDFIRSKQLGDIFIAQTVLHVAGNKDYYNNVQENSFLAYNGEIYNTPGNYSNDIELVHNLIENRKIDSLKDFWGMWAFTWTDGNNILYGTDPQGEKVLYRYVDDDLLIISTEIRAILTYIDDVKNLNYSPKHWCFPSYTCYKNIFKLEPGYLYWNNLKYSKIETLYDWIGEDIKGSEDELYEEFDSIWKNTIRKMTPLENSSVLYSGGVDSSIIINEMQNPELLTAECVGKDNITCKIADMLREDELKNLIHLRVSEKEWGQTAKEIVNYTRQPIQSWNFVNQWLLLKECSNRIVFSGTGADELFGGYDVYKNFNTNTKYSNDDDQTIFHHAFKKYNDEYKSRLLSDYIYQVSSCDARGTDLISGFYGIECRSPFMAKPIIQFALKLPKKYRIGKPFLRRKFLERWDNKFLTHKEGFSGHCNDSLPYMGISIKETKMNRDEEWKQIMIELFKKYA